MRYHGTCAAVVLGLLIGAIAAQAQSSTTQAAGDTALARELATITTDTGDFTPGHRDFSRYRSPGLCVAAVRTTERILENTIAGVYGTNDAWEGVTHQGSPKHIAQQCGANLTVANTASPEWWALFDLALLSGRDSVAQQVLVHRIAAASSAAARIALELEAFHIYLGGPQNNTNIFPVLVNKERWMLARALVAKWQAQPDKGLSYYGTITLKKREKESLNAITENVVTMGHQVNDSMLREVSADLQEVFRVRMHGALDGIGESESEVAQEALRDLQSFSSDSVCVAWFPRCRTNSVAKVDSFLHTTWAPGLHFPRLQHVFWFPPKGMPSDTIFPVPGKVTLMVKTPVACQVDQDVLLWFAECSQAKAVVTHVLHEYSAKDVAIVLVADERGHAFLSGAQTAEQEAERIRWYFQDFEELPVTVAVQWPPQWKTLPAPDSRRFGSYSFYQWTERQLDHCSYLLTDREGRRNHRLGFPDKLQISWTNWLAFDDLDSEIERLVSVPTQ